MKLGFGLLGILAFVSSSQQIYTPDIWLSIHRWQTSTIRFWKSKQKSMNTMMSTSPKRPRRRARMMTGLGWLALGQSLVISRRRLSLWPSTLWGMTKTWQNVVDNLLQLRGQADHILHRLSSDPDVRSVRGPLCGVHSYGEKCSAPKLETKGSRRFHNHGEGLF